MENKNALMRYMIVGGNIYLPKKLFIQELLSRESLLRRLLNWQSTGDFAGKHPCVGEPDQNGIIPINFSSDAIVSIGESPKEILGALKSKYRERIRGKVALQIIETTFGHMMSFSVDLNSSDGEIDYVEL